MSWPDKAVREVAIAFLVELVLIALKATFHEFLSVPAAVVCKRGTDTVDLEIESTGPTGRTSSGASSPGAFSTGTRIRSRNEAKMIKILCPMVAFTGLLASAAYAAKDTQLMARVCLL